MWVSNRAWRWAALLPFGPSGSASAANIRRKSAGANGLVSAKGSKPVEQSQIYGCKLETLANHKASSFKWYRTETIPLFSHWSLTGQLKAMMTALWLYHPFDVMDGKVHQLQVTVYMDFFFARSVPLIVLMTCRFGVAPHHMVKLWLNCDYSNNTAIC